MSMGSGIPRSLTSALRVGREPTAAVGGGPAAVDPPPLTSRPPGPNVAWHNDLGSGEEPAARTTSRGARMSPEPPNNKPQGAGPRPDASPRTITKKELVARIAERTAQTKVVARDVIQLFLDEIIEELGRGNRLEFREFGVFEIKERAARKAQNPRTLEKVDVPAKRVVKFRVGRLMKERVAQIPEGTRLADGSEDYDEDDED